MGLTHIDVWAASDGRAGIEAQALGLAEAVARLRPATVTVKRIRWKAGLGRAPSWLNLAPRLFLARSSEITPPWPDIFIAAGRASLPVATRIGRWSGGRTFVVQTQNPRTDLSAFDLVIPPVHDRLEGDNVFPITGAPNRLTVEKLSASLTAFHEVLAPLPRPHVAVIVGGKSKAFDLPPARASAMAEEIAAAIAAAGGSLLLSFTRRTPQAAQDILRERLSGLSGSIWDGQGENPYFAFLASADAVLITEDSTNLATDAAATGKPVHVLSMTGGHEKFRRFHDDLRARDATRPFRGRLEAWSYPPLAETDRAAAEVLRRYDLKAAARA